MRKLLWFEFFAFGAILLPKAATAQGIAITPQIGVYVPGDDFESLRAGADSVSVRKEGTLALGFNVDVGFLRGTVAYASAAKLNRGGAQGEVGEGKLLAVAGAVVLRPIPRLLILQPYLLAGAGLRRADYDFDDDGLANAFPENDSDFALHAGIGADVMIGSIGVTAEITDFISKDDEDKWGRHDGFGFVGVKLRL
ncbi:MAG: hypothetical protein ACT4O1_14670 [Gemmatimonadota bacterium]